MPQSNLFEQMLSTYPAEKRELAREVFHRFADGDSTQFFSQLFLVLDVHAHYIEQIPSRMMAANADSLATMQEIQGEIAHIAKTIEARDVNITKHAQKTDELCKVTQARCDEMIARVESMIKNLGSQVDTRPIVKGVEDALKDIFLPLKMRADNLAYAVGSTAEKINTAAERAARLWPRHIWKTALTASVVIGLSIAALGIGVTYWQMKRHFDQTLAHEIQSERFTLQHNKDAFQQLAVAGVPVYVAQCSDSDGHLIPGGYCLYIPNAQGADMQGGNGRIFFTSSRSESELKRLREVQQPTQ
jgi:hypothetical protein